MTCRHTIFQIRNVRFGNNFFIRIFGKFRRVSIVAFRKFNLREQMFKICMREIFFSLVFKLNYHAFNNIVIEIWTYRRQFIGVLFLQILRVIASA